MERSEGEEEGEIDARLSVTQSDDPRSGGHLALGMSKTPLKRGEQSERRIDSADCAHPGPARERGRVVVHGVVALDVADRKHARSHVSRESPISNGSTAVAAEKGSATQS